MESNFISTDLRISARFPSAPLASKLRYCRRRFPPLFPPCFLAASAPGAGGGDLLLLSPTQGDVSKFPSDSDIQTPHPFSSLSTCSSPRTPTLYGTSFLWARRKGKGCLCTQGLGESGPGGDSVMHFRLLLLPPGRETGAAKEKNEEE